ncbi:polysaccharide export protein [Thermosulfuriphilus ammonigenes]|uniref:Polysaccharide export protein n=1 Tax=Thermosulfuriphilus ammonigenes TaxID=1936021 RepID=A0A6G7PUE8_9BACT|nr:polysaccharide biosynthesis/export family protein [Thermosulfuriphilus ammonigenes]MBA2848552.1 polysaccharide export outer membrane protein [Thermosulfuriphilus ammonigenes]QIJ71305.1 polysaccharide export protein [Thermosulfuriphilus ammonigenes]
MKTAFLRGLLFLSLCLFLGKGLAGAETTSVEGPYTIGPGDVLEVLVWHEPDLSRSEIIVRTDGMITLPLVNDIRAAGLTPMELKGAIEKKLKKYIEVPEVSVTVKQSYKVFYIIGKINKPGEYPLVKRLTVLQALSKAGGLAEWANEENIIILRREGNKEKKLRFNYKRVIQGEDLEQNIFIRPDDTIVVP